ncbi:hypothetical protein [Candidatus Solincola sp.]|jgi:hypothetical protein|nr:hypothetical protein [Actinomycetota bacterium]
MPVALKEAQTGPLLAVTLAVKGKRKRKGAYSESCPDRATFIMQGISGKLRIFRVILWELRTKYGYAILGVFDYFGD